MRHILEILRETLSSKLVISTNAGIQLVQALKWIPVFAGSIFSVYLLVVLC